MPEIDPAILEKAAKAICESTQIVDGFARGGLRWDGLDEEERSFFHRQAQAALTAAYPELLEERDKANELAANLREGIQARLDRLHTAEARLKEVERERDRLDAECQAEADLKGAAERKAMNYEARLKELAARVVRAETAAVRNDARWQRAEARLKEVEGEWDEAKAGRREAEMKFGQAACDRETANEKADRWVATANQAHENEERLTERLADATEALRELVRLRDAHERGDDRAAPALWSAMKDRAWDAARFTLTRLRDAE